MIELVLGTLLGTWLSFLVSLMTKQLETWPFVLVLIVVGLWFMVKRPGLKESKMFWITVLGWGRF